MKVKIAVKNKETKDLSNEDIKTLLRPLKWHGDCVMPTLKKYLLQCFELWKDRGYLPYGVESEPTNVDDDENYVVSDASIESMEI